MALPAALYQKLGWPWAAFWDAKLEFKIFWNFSLFIAFGFFHSLLAQKFAQRWLKKILPSQCARAFYLCFTGLSLLALMGCWQSTGIITWWVPGLPFWASSAISMLIYYGLLFVIARMMSSFDTLEFLGLRQIYSRVEEIDEMSSQAALIVTGMYGKVRHPIYLFTLAAFLITPIMSLDRLTLLAASLTYLHFGVRIEERKLGAQFGAAYAEYQRRVPMILPLPLSIARRFPLAAGLKNDNLG